MLCLSQRVSNTNKNKHNFIAPCVLFASSVVATPGASTPVNFIGLTPYLLLLLPSPSFAPCSCLDTTNFHTSSNGLCACSLRYQFYVTHGLSFAFKTNLVVVAATNWNSEAVNFNVRKRDKSRWKVFVFEDGKLLADNKMYHKIFCQQFP